MPEISVQLFSQDDLGETLAIYDQAFPDEDLKPLVKALVGGQDPVLSLSAFREAVLVGHALFSPCHTTSSDRKGALLGPVAVASRVQKQGVGSALIRDGFQRLSDQGVQQLFVLGDPKYYHRFGFQAERSVETPYPIPSEWATAWQSLTMSGQSALPAGVLSLPKPWMNAAYWGE